MGWWWFIAAALAMPRAEVDRLSDEMRRLAAKGAWTGVERSYALVLEGGGELARTEVLIGAESARNTGDVLSRIERLAQAQALSPSEEVQTAIDEVMTGYGRVQLVPERRGGTLEAAEMPFRPDAAQAIRFGLTPGCAAKPPSSGSPLQEQRPAGSTAPSGC